ncbi:MAG: ThiF family adenylyltransferase, partial [Oceanococcaceae bacterium]
RSNLHRQSLYTEDQQGQWKVEAAAARLQQRNAQVQIQALRQRLDSEALRELIVSADLVIDATDDTQSKQQSSSLARVAGVPWALAGLERQTGGIYLSPTPVEQGVCWNCLVGQGGMACSERGVLGPTPAVLGALLAQAALSQLLGWDNGWAGHWSVFDLSGARLLRLQAQQRAECLCAPSTVKEVHSLDDQRQWVDLRNAAERAALPLPGATLLQELEEAAAWDRLGPYTLICTRGQRSARAAAQMQAMGFVDVASLAGGLAALERSA